MVLKHTKITVFAQKLVFGIRQLQVGALQRNRLGFFSSEKNEDHNSSNRERPCQGDIVRVKYLE